MPCGFLGDVLGNRGPLKEKRWLPYVRPSGRGMIVGILDCREKILRNKVVLMVKVPWKSDKVEKMIWETEASMRKRYSYLFSD